MHDLTLAQGGRLMRTVSDRETGTPIRRDVSEAAHQFLFETVTLAEGVTLADVFTLLANDPVLVQVYRRDFAEELLAHVGQGPLKTDKPNEPESLEYLELYQVLDFDSGTKALEGDGMLQFHGIGFELQTDVDMGGYTQPKGSRIQWGISLTDVREMLLLPLRVKTEVLVCESDLDAKAYGHELTRFQRPQVTLGQVLHGVLWELSFHGAPAEQDAVRAGLQERSADVEAALEREQAGEPSGLIDAEDLFEDFDKPGVAALFESDGGLRASDISLALRALEDDADVPFGLARQLGERADGLVIRPAYRDLPARAFRRAFREARPA